MYHKLIITLLLFCSISFGQSGKSVLTQAQKDSINAMIESYVDTSSNGVNYKTFEYYGAVGDGITNDSAALASALNSGNSIKGIIGKTYLISGSLNIHSNTILDGNGSTIKLANNVADSSTILLVTGCNNILFYNITLDANYQNQTGKVFCTRSRGGSKNITYNNVKFFNQTTHGSLFLNADSLITFTNCYFGNTSGYHIQPRNSFGFKIEGCTFENWGQVTNNPISAIQFQNGGQSPLIKNNYFINSYGLGFAIESTETVNNAQIESNHLAGDYIGISGAFSNSRIFGNNFIDGIGSWRSGIELVGNNNIISKNILVDGSILLTSSANDHSYNNIVESNTIRNTSSNGFGIRLDCATHGQEQIQIIRNIIDLTDANNSCDGIRVGFYRSDTSDLVLENIFVENNQIFRNSTTPQGVGIRIAPDSSSSEIIIKNNTVYGFYSGIKIDENDSDDLYNVSFIDNNVVNNFIPFQNISPIASTFTYSGNKGLLTSNRGYATTTNNGTISDSILIILHNINIPLNPKNILLSLHSYMNNASYIYVDDVTDSTFKIKFDKSPDTTVNVSWRIFDEKPTQFLTNLKNNSGFEIFTGVADDIYTDNFANYIEDSTSGDIIAISDAYAGDYSIRFVRDAANPYNLNEETLSVEPNGYYRISFFTRGDGTNAGTYRVSDLTNSTVLINWTSTNVVNAYWTFKEVYLTIPNNCISIRINLSVENNVDAYADFDELKLQKVIE